MPKTLLNKAVIISKLAEHEAELHKFGVSRIGLFGSYLHGKQQTASDIDFLLDFQPGKKTFKNFVNLGYFLEDLFQKKIELVTPQSLSPYIGQGILKSVEYVPVRN